MKNYKELDLRPLGKVIIFRDRQTDRQTLHHYIFIIIITVNIIIITLLRRQRKDKNGHSPQGSVLGYSDPANEKLLPGPRNGTINHR